MMCEVMGFSRPWEMLKIISCNGSLESRFATVGQIWEFSRKWWWAWKESLCWFASGFDVLHPSKKLQVQFSKTFVICFFLHVADVSFCKVGKIQEEFVANESNMSFLPNKKGIFWISKVWKSHTELKLFVLSNTWFHTPERSIMPLKI